MTPPTKSIDVLSNANEQSRHGSVTSHQEKVQNSSVTNEKNNATSQLNPRGPPPRKANKYNKQGRQHYRGGNGAYRSNNGYRGGGTRKAIAASKGVQAYRRVSSRSIGSETDSIGMQSFDSNMVNNTYNNHIISEGDVVGARVHSSAMTNPPKANIPGSYYPSPGGANVMYPHLQPAAMPQQQQAIWMHYAPMHLQSSAVRASGQPNKTVVQSMNTQQQQIYLPDYYFAPENSDLVFTPSGLAVPRSNSNLADYFYAEQQASQSQQFHHAMMLPNHYPCDDMYYAQHLQQPMIEAGMSFVGNTSNHLIGAEMYTLPTGNAVAGSTSASRRNYAGGRNGTSSRKKENFGRRKQNHSEEKLRPKATAISSKKTILEKPTVSCLFEFPYLPNGGEEVKEEQTSELSKSGSVEVRLADKPSFVAARSKKIPAAKGEKQVPGERELPQSHLSSDDQKNESSNKSNEKPQNLLTSGRTRKPNHSKLSYTREQRANYRRKKQAEADNAKADFCQEASTDNCPSNDSTSMRKKNSHQRRKESVYNGASKQNEVSILEKNVAAVVIA